MLQNCCCGHGSCPAHNKADIKHASCRCMNMHHTTHIHTMVEALELSGQVTFFQVPLEIMGSIVKVCLVVLLGLCRQQSPVQVDGGGLLL